MSAKARSVVLAFYSGDEAYAGRAYHTLRNDVPSVQYFQSNGIRSDSSKAGEKYSALRLPGEELIVVEVEPAKVPAIVTTLRAAGEPGVFFSRQGFDGEDHPSAPKICTWRGVLDNLRQCESALKAARGELLEACRVDHTVTESAKWLLDNTHLLRGSIGDIRRSLPTGFRRVLSRFTAPDGNLHVCELARRTISRANNALTEQILIDAVSEYQLKAPLSIAELWVFPVMLRFALVEALAGLAERVGQEQELREAAYLWANRLAAAARAGGESLPRMLALLKSQPMALQPYFVTCLAEQLQDEESALVPARQWFETQLGKPLADLVRPEHSREAAESLSVANAFNSLRTLSHINFAEFFESLNVVESALRRDPSGSYPRSDFLTRDICRRSVEELSRRSGHGEQEVAQRAIELATNAFDEEKRQVCWYLVGPGVRILEKELHAKVPWRVRLIRAVRSGATFFYLAGITSLTLCFVAFALSLAWELGVHGVSTLSILGFLALFPLSELALHIVNALVISYIAPQPLVKLDFEEGIPEEHTALVVVPMMLTGMEVVRQEIEKLEVRFLANQDPHLYFSLFSDYTDADEKTAPNDAELYEAICNGIEDLNRRYAGDRFLLFHRDRVWSATEGRWIGRERKRGKIEDLNRCLRGKGSGEIIRVGQLPPQPVRYVITLDADTQLPPNTGKKLVATIAHPLNRPVLDPVTKVRQRGFSIIQPRVSISLPGATASRFTRVFADTSGTDPYCHAVSDAQQDLFGEAIFHGKAIYDVEAFDESVGDRFPVETLLSHDLIEGSYAGVALASDIELFEFMPLDYAGFSKRGHRWIRGDWQIAGWALHKVRVASGERERNPLSVISRWRILDNLRRSLVPVASMLLLLAGWLISPAPGAWSLVVGLAIAIPAVAPLLDRLARRIQGSVIGWQGAWDEVLRAIVMIAFLPHQAWIAADAVWKVGYRKLVSRKRLLEWQTAERAASDSRLHMSSTMRQMAFISAGSALLMIVLLAEKVFAPVVVFVAAWVASPALLYWLNRPITNTRTRRLLHTHHRLLRGFARQTWRFFDDLVNDSTNWLPPDNYQVALHVEVANRTSPTNIGLWLCSAMSARDFGYLTADDLLNRCTKTFDTLSRLQRYEGHLLNWYDTTSTEPLYPRYVSTVDSGNLLASLWVFAQGAHDLVRAPLIASNCVRGLTDTLEQVEAAGPDDPSFAIPLQTLRKLLRGKPDSHQLIGRVRMAQVPASQLAESCRYAPPGEEHAYWALRLEREVKAWNQTIDLYLKWVETLSQLPDFLLKELGDDVIRLRRRVLHQGWSLESIASGGPAALRQILEHKGQAGMQPRVAAWLADLDRDFQEAQRNAAQAARNWHALAARAFEFSEQINMGFLFDTKRKLFGIGYVVGGPVEFTSHYDLLASECRIASLVAIAKGDVPLAHWFALGRPRVGNSEGQTLLSWSGTMFEYLMPLLFTRSFDNSLLDSACRNAVQEQMAWGREKNLPWGVSECAWSALDSNQTYQYHAFGVPALALKAGLEEQDVVAPYATMLSLQVDLGAAVDNLIRLRKLDMEGPMGFYEALDFTRQSTSEGKRGVVIYAYMSHHQGMSMLALSNVLHRGIMQRRFHAESRIRAIESLLFERVPSAPLPSEDIRGGLSAPLPAVAEDPAERVWKENTAVPRVHLYGNGRYSLMVTNAGGSYSRWNDFDLTRWRSDPASDAWGSFLYIRDLKAQTTWSASWQPIGGSVGASSVRFLADHTEYHRRALDIETLQAVTVAAEDDAELRRLTITNWSTRTREIELTSYAELVLAPHAADAAHPAFAKMFIETEYAGDGLLLAYRRQRSPEDPPVWAGHMLQGFSGAIQYETDRASFLGRCNTTASPDALRRDLNGATGTVIDPVFSLRCRVTLAPRDRVQLAFVTFAASSREALIALAEKYRRPGAVSQAFELMWTRSQLQFRYLGIGPSRAHRFQELASYLLYPNPRLRPTDRVLRNRLGQSGIWALGISGDLPIVTVTIADERNINLVRELLQAHTYWRMRGLRADLVILNQESPSYDLPLRQHLLRLVEAHSLETGTDKPGGVFLRDWHPMPEDLRNLLLACSSVVTSASRGSLQQQMAGMSEAGVAGARFIGEVNAEEPSRPLPFLELPYFNGQGGFSKDGREYAVYLKPGDTTPAPWVNVMANANFGALVSESGLGFTWRGNSQMNRLTPWNNDPVSDEPSEVIYLRDEESGACWSPTPQPIRESDAYRARHGQGYTIFEHNSHAIGQELTVFVPLREDGSGDPIKIYRLRLRNDSSHQRRLSVTYFAELVLGGTREASQLHIQTSRDEPSQAILARQYWNGSYAGYVAFAASSPAPSSWSGDRTAFLGRNRTVARPVSLERAKLDNRTGVALDPAAALQVRVLLAQGAETEVVFFLGQTESVEECRALLKNYQTREQVENALRATTAWWDHVLGAIQVKTPLLSADLLLNRWLLYQSLSCRFWGRSAFYQSSGAMGFRDQLQDSLAFLYAAPRLTRDHILLAAGRQFAEGDVQHWWHNETGMGVRTKCSDDLVWLPFVVAHYVEVTGDRGILDEQIAFLEAPPLAPGEHERLSVPSVTHDTAPLWEHCERALERAWQLGVHELPLMGNGDWNDGMNEVGAAGKGESVWLAWFLASVLNSFADVLDGEAVPHGRPGLTADWRQRASQLAAATERTAWDGDWYLRAFFDNGEPLGSHANAEARIDSLPQSWSVISGLGDHARRRQAMDSAQALLADTENKLVRLFTPPFDKSEPHPGYIMGYPPGLRENGGQYTHGSLWMAMAWARLGEGDRAAGLLTMMSPVERTRTPEDVARYCAEPYAVAADVSTAPGRVGRAGWTFYTGSAAWMYRIWIEEVLGFKLRGDTLTLQPAVPAAWPEFEIRFRYQAATYTITVNKDAAPGRARFVLDGQAFEGAAIRLSGEGTHTVVVSIAPADAAAAAPATHPEPELETAPAR